MVDVNKPGLGIRSAKPLIAEVLLTHFAISSTGHHAVLFTKEILLYQYLSATWLHGARRMTRARSPI